VSGEAGGHHLAELRLFLEDVVCDLCRFEHVARDGLAAEDVRIDREAWLASGCFADVRVGTPGRPAYYVEVKFGYREETLRRSLTRKYGSRGGSERVILVLDTDSRPGWSETEAELRCLLDGHVILEVWNEQRLRELIHERFGVVVRTFTESELLDLRDRIDEGKGFHAFGGESRDAFRLEQIHGSLLWHLSFFHIRQIRRATGLGPREILPPGLYRNVVVLLADLSSFSSYVRDTRDDDLVRVMLTSFYSKARYQVINSGGMMVQFVGDEIVALFGAPDQAPGFIDHALETARALVDIGQSVSQEWQRSIDRVQTASGLHVGMAMGDIQVLSLRPFSRSHIGCIGDAINLGARLLAEAGPSEIVISNSLHHRMTERAQEGFVEAKPVDAKNVGRVQSWRLSCVDR
jgi:class 3 adenylate cyclase